MGAIIARLFYAEGPHAFWVFLVLTLVLGGGLAFATGRGIAQTWRPYSHVAMYMLPLACAVQFLHFALFEEKLLSVHYLIIAYLITLASATMGYRMMRVEQMVRQYPWLHEKTGLLSWSAPGAGGKPPA